MRSKILILVVLLATVFLEVEAQNGKIAGKIVDKSNNETMIGVVVQVEGTSRGAASDVEGRYMIPNLVPGAYTITVNYVGYKSKIIKGIAVVADEVTNADIEMEIASNDLKEVEIVSTVSKESVLGLQLFQKNNASVVDGVSSETIKRTPDKSTSDVLKRVSGASIQDNKFAIIRGLNDRYNAAYLNGAALPSSESDRKAFAFDIFPSSMLDNLVIVKTATPDMPAEFAGGIIQINTKNIPEKNFQSLTVGGSYNTITTFKDQVYYKGGKWDWLGLDDGTRSMPSAIPAQADFPTSIHDQAALAKQTDVDWKLYDKKFAPNASFQYSWGYSVPLRGKPLGIIAALTYNKSGNYNETVRRSYTGDGITESQLESDYLDKTYSEQVLAGALANLSFRITDNNILSFKNIYSINSDDRVIVRTGTPTPLDANPQLINATARWFTSNKIYSGQLNGEHYLKKSKVRINWVGALSQIERAIPNLRRSIHSRFTNFIDPSSPNPYDTVYKAEVSLSNVGPSYGGGMFFSENKEKIYSFKGEASYGFGRKVNSDVKVGGLVQNRRRDFFARQLGYTGYGVVGGNITFKDSLLYLTDNNIFSNANMGLISPGVGGFKLTDGTKPNDAYQASSDLQAAYAMLDSKYKKLRLVWGARFENFTQELHAKRNTVDSLNLVTHKADLLPSGNLIFSASEKQNIRVSYYQTLNRPEYRELAPFAFYDFNTRFVISGNDSLKRAKIHNADLRYEYYPGRGQIFSGTVFYKRFINPIEQISRVDATNEISFQNASLATNYGMEIEFRCLLGALLKRDSSKVLNKLTFFSNLSFIRSRVDISTTAGNQTRTLQGQSPYVLNGGLQYIDQDKGFSLSASFNRVGSRIYIVGNVQEPDIWEQGRSFLDFQAAKSLRKNRMEIKLNIQNILAQNQVYYQNWNFDQEKAGAIKGFFNKIATGDAQNKNAYNSKEDDLIWSTNFGPVFSLNFSMKF